MRAGTVALVVRYDAQAPVLVASLSDDKEITLLEQALIGGKIDAFQSVLDHRAQSEREDEEFANYIEELLSQPFVRPEIQEHGVQWFKSKMRIEEFQRTESEATRVIAEYAIKIFLNHPDRTEFLLAGPNATVAIRVFVMPSQSARGTQAA